MLAKVVFFWFYIVFLTRTFAMYNNTADIFLTCDENDLTVYFEFEYPFHGRVFVSEQSHKPECSYDAPDERTESFNMSINFSDCESFFYHIENVSYIYTSVEINMSSIYYYELRLACVIDGPDIIPFILPDIYSSDEFPEIESLFEIESGLQIYPEDVSDSLEISEELMIMYHVKDGTKNLTSTVHNSDYDSSLVSDKMRLVKRAINKPNEAVSNNTQMLYRTRIVLSKQPNQDIRNITFETKEFDRYDQLNQFKIFPSIFQKPDELRNLIGEKMGGVKTVNKLNETTSNNTQMSYRNKIVLSRQPNHNITKHISDNAKLNDFVAKPLYDMQSHFKESTITSRDAAPMNDSDNENPERAKRVVTKSNIETPPHSLQWILFRRDVFKIQSSNGVPATVFTNDELLKVYLSRSNALNYTQSPFPPHALQSKVLKVNRKEIKNGTLLHSNFFTTSALYYTQSLTQQPKNVFICFAQIAIAGLFLCGVSYVCYFLFSVRYRPAYNVAHNLYFTNRI